MNFEFLRTLHGFINLLQVLLLLYAICLILLIVSASLETWYIRLSAGYLHSRFIAVTVGSQFAIVLKFCYIKCQHSGIQLAPSCELCCFNSCNHTICIDCYLLRLLNCFSL
ncbi:hypothetical protein ANCDUO_01238 [Ancylostoma duodenale]|uniref:Uncharacterized protein n=1 Tax=Ancylostoma duodenale TaxID=51022 RepID=A0A0C2H3N0_9BILA|nr:hypothetical protein ANCDUO_01238 [Ancylostoma duodenale]